MKVRNRRSRRGYTLIELMAVVTIVGVLATLTVGASVKYMATARARSTEAMIQILDAAVTQRWESFWAKSKVGALPVHQTLAGVGATNEGRILHLRRANLIAKLDAMRGDFPQQFSDFLPTPAGGFSVGLPSKTRVAIERRYRELTYATNPAAVPNNNNPAQPTQIAPHDPIAESSACLYLMLLVSSGEGNSFDMSQIKPEFLKDTDGDGIPEFVDSWGTPLRFYRWPTDYLTYLYSGVEPTATGPAAMTTPADFPANALDPGNLLQTPVWSTAFGAQFETTQGYFRIRDPIGNVPFAFPTYPLIVSAGPDARNYVRDDRWQAFGLSFDGSETGGAALPTGQINYSWPATTGGSALTASEFRAVRMGKPVMTAGAPGAGASVDNIVSRRIRAGQEHQ